MSDTATATFRSHARRFRRRYKHVDVEAVPRTALQWREVIRDFLEKSGLSGAELARLMGKPSSTVGRWTQKDPVAPSRENVAAIVAALKDDPERQALAIRMLSDPPVSVGSSTAAAGRGSYTVKFSETETIAKMLDAITDEAERLDAFERCFSALRGHRSPRKAEQA